MSLGPTPAVLSEDDCWLLAGSRGVGRLSVTVAALPWVVPARYRIDRHQLIVCLGDRAELRRSLDRTIVALAVDSFDQDGSHGWLVHFQGLASVLDESSACPLHPLAAGIASVSVEGMTYSLCDAFVAGDG